MSALRHMRGATLFAVACLATSAFVAPSGQVVNTILITALLGVLEISLSFDNAVVDAQVLGTMTLKWQKRFLTWGVLISILGMRTLMPLAFVSTIVWLNPVDALLLAIHDEHRYAEIMQSAHEEIAAFGGSFLLLVFLAYFFDHKKDGHWLEPIERGLTAGAAWLHSLTRINLTPSVLTALVASVVAAMAWSIGLSFLIAGMAGIMVWIVIKALSHLMEFDATSGAKQGFVGFLYLETLDGSFSFDGVVAAFALSKSIFIIALGLGIGAAFVRSITIMLVRQKTLTEYRYLEHGAFWAIGALAVLMLASVRYDVPEVATGLVGATLIGAALLSSIVVNRREAQRIPCRT